MKKYIDVKDLKMHFVNPSGEGNYGDGILVLDSTIEVEGEFVPERVRQAMNLFNDVIIIPQKYASSFKEIDEKGLMSLLVLDDDVLFDVFAEEYGKLSDVIEKYILLKFDDIERCKVRLT